MAGQVPVSISCGSPARLIFHANLPRRDFSAKNDSSGLKFSLP